MSESAKEAQTAGRGVIYIAVAKMYFMVAGAVIEFRLPAILSNLVFGAYAVVASTVSPFNNVLVTGSIQSVSRFTAQKPGMSHAIQRTGLRMHLYVGLPVAAAFIALAPAMAYFFQDMSKTGPLMLAGFIIAGYSFYAVFVGTVNGRKQFHKQAGLDMCFATLRAVGILGLAILGFGLYGALTGWVGAVGVILVIAMFVVGMPGKAADAEEAQPLRPMIMFFISVAVYLILMNLIMSVDQLLIKRLTTQWYASNIDELSTAFRAMVPESLLGPDWKFDASAAADGQVGYYRAVQNLARLSYQAIIAATFVIFPLVSRTTFEDDTDTTKRYIRTTMRYSLIFSMAIAVVFAANPLPLLDIPYAEDYAFFGAPALVALALGNVAFSIFVIAGTILNGAGYTRQAIITGAVTLALAAGANAIVIPMFDPGRDVLLAAACATGGAMFLGAAIGGYYLHRTLGAFLPLLTFVRVLIATGVAIGVGRVLTFTTPLMTLAEGCVVGLSFIVALIVMRELTMADLRAVTLVARRKKGDSK